VKRGQPTLSATPSGVNVHAKRKTELPNAAEIDKASSQEYNECDSH